MREQQFLLLGLIVAAYSLSSYRILIVSIWFGIGLGYMVVVCLGL